MQDVDNLKKSSWDNFMANTIEKIKKSDSSSRLGFAETVGLFENVDLHEIGQRALECKRQRFGDQVFWIRNVHVNYTNVCINRCDVCLFSRRTGQSDAYTLEVGEIVSRVAAAVEGGVREVHIVGGINPQLTFTYYLELIRELRKSFPELYIRAFTASEIDHLSNISNSKAGWVLEQLRSAGLNAMPGGGAEIFSDRVRREIFPGKISSDRWLEIHELAHGLGLESNATMLFGHIETFSERVDHLIKLRELQDRTKGFKAFVPLPVVGYQGMEGVDGMEALRTLAISRLVLDNFEHIKVFWPIWGAKLSQLALSYGADDFDGTVGSYKIINQNGLDVETLKDLILQAGFKPVERDSRYERIGD
jgi:aminodeoxyfutalosine synthase